MQWSKAVAALQEQAAHVQTHASTRELVQYIRRDKALLLRLVEVAMCDQDARTALLALVERVEPMVTGLHMQNRDQFGTLFLDAARSDSSSLILSRLVEETRELVDWQSICFRLAYEQAHIQSQFLALKTKRKSNGKDSLDQLQARTRLVVVEEGSISWQDRTRGSDPIKDLSGKITANPLGHQGHRLVPIASQTSGPLTGDFDAAMGKQTITKTSYDFRTPPADSFSPYDYLYRFFKGCVALAVVDESHNGRGRDTDIARSHHFAMLAAQTRQLTSGTHYGGDILGFYHYWYRYHPGFWRRLDFGWQDAKGADSLWGSAAMDQRV